MGLLEDINAMVSDVFLAVAGVAVVGVTITLCGQFVYRVLMWRSATGHIIGFKRREGCHFPRVEFIDLTGQTIEFVSDAGSGVRGHRVGDQVRVLYHPNDPAKAAVRSFRYLWAAPIMIVIIAAVFVLVAIKEWAS